MPHALSSRWRRLTRAVGYGAVVAFAVGVVAFLVRTKFGPLVDLDQRVIVAATDVTRSHAGFRSLAETWETISQPWVMYLVVGLPTCLFVWFGQHLRTLAWWGLATMASGWAIAGLFKALVRRARPVIDEPFSQHAGFSFPSGHTTNNAIVITVVLLLLGRSLSHGRRIALTVLGSLWVVVTCVDRVFMGAHFPSDVVAGVLLGSGLSLASYAGYLGWKPPTPTSPAGPTEGPL